MNKTDIRKPRRHLVAAACLTALMGATGAQAVQVASEGLGQVLIYPYYTVQPDASGAAYDTYISIVNVTTASKAIKVRFLEGRNGREVMDFNLYLSPHDTWAAAITQAPGGGARMVFNDKSCIQPVTYKGTAVDFYSKNYTGANADGGDPSILRTREGWVEVYEMGVVSNTLLQAAMKQDSNGEPPACNAFDAASASQFSMPAGGLMGQVNLINVKTGGSYNYDAVALTGMEYGGITPIGIPADWALYVDCRIPALGDVVIGAGIRDAKILLPGALLAELARAQVIEGLARIPD